MSLLVILALAIVSAIALASCGVAPIVATLFALPSGCAIWFAGWFFYGAIMGVVEAFRFSFGKDRN